MPLKLTERFRKQYIKLPLVIRHKVDKSLKLLDSDFRHPGLRSHPVEGAPGIFEAYVDRKYRLTYERSGDTLILRNVDNHDECLREP
jgi:mRNA-degrading endonuclease YafQ of YafQ-DinJ toxin-antitoxin module